MPPADAAAAPADRCSRSPPPRPKATLFCPECGHEAPLSEGWELRATDDALAVVCPDCSTVVAPRTA